jgi:hypothetical protein
MSLFGFYMKKNVLSVSVVGSAFELAKNINFLINFFEDRIEMIDIKKIKECLIKKNIYKIYLCWHFFLII